MELFIGSIDETFIVLVEITLLLFELGKSLFQIKYFIVLIHKISFSTFFVHLVFPFKVQKLLLG